MLAEFIKTGDDMKVTEKNTYNYFVRLVTKYVTNTTIYRYKCINQIYIALKVT